MKVIDQAWKLVEQVITLSQPRGPDDEIEELTKLSDQALLLLNSIPVPDDRLELARFYYLHGELMFASHKYSDAIDNFTKVLDPHLTVARASHSLCLMKTKKEMDAFAYLETFKESNDKSVLRTLAFLDIQMAEGVVAAAEGNAIGLADRSVRHALKALEVDKKDGFSLFALGNARFMQFKASGYSDSNHLDRALEAYIKSGRDKLMKHNPFLYFHKAKVEEMKENYVSALELYQQSSCLAAGTRMNWILHDLGEIDGLLEGLNLGEEDTGFERAVPPRGGNALIHLKRGKNPNIVVAGTCVLHVDQMGETPPEYFILLDPHGVHFLITVYGASVSADHHKGYIESDKLVEISDPYYAEVRVNWGQESYDFLSVRADTMDQVHVDGKALTPRRIEICSNGLDGTNMIKNEYRT